MLIENPIGIDKRILDDLLKRKVHTIEVTIIGVERLSFRRYISLITIKQQGQLMDYDRRKDGQSFTGYGVQYIFSYDWGSDKLQTTLV